MNNLKRIKNVLLSLAISDGVGIQFKMLTKKFLKNHFRGRGDIEPEIYLKDKMGIFPCLEKPNHTRTEAGKWSYSTSHFLLSLFSLLENKGVNVYDIATKLNHWKFNGISELGETYGSGMEGPMSLVVEHSSFTMNPIDSARAIYRRSGMCSNGCLSRILPLPCYYSSYPKVLKETLKICSITHLDRRCLVASLVINTILYDCLYGKRYNYLRFGDKFLKSKSDKRDFERYTTFKNLDEVYLDGEDSNYVFKTMACCIYAFRNRKRNFKEVIIEIVKEGGDTDTNSAIAGAILGSVKEFTDIPEDWINGLKNKEYLFQKLREDSPEEKKETRIEEEIINDNFPIVDLPEIVALPEINFPIEEDNQN